MFVGISPEMALLHCKLQSPTSFVVEYRTPALPVAPATPSQSTVIEIPFEPQQNSLERIDITMHTVPTYPAFRMPNDINTWFSEALGYEVILAYMGDVLGVKRQDEKTQEWDHYMTTRIPSKLGSVNFSDGGAILVVSEASLEDLHPRLEGERALMEKFSPNIVVAGLLPWDVGESGNLLKKMMRDRRIDRGNKWTPIFGRYGFPVNRGEIAVGDEIAISVRNEDHTVWSKF
jgi:uncharacterized protein YcbX